MHVVFGDERDVEVENVTQLDDVDPARGDVGRDQDLQLPALEVGERAGALRLRAVAVDTVDLDVVLFEERRQAVRPRLRPGEGDRAEDAAALQQFDQQVALARLVDRVDDLRDADGGSDRRREIDAHRRAQHLAAQRDDLVRHRRGEEQRLTSGRNLFEDAANGREESHVEHPVGLVDHEQRDRAERARFLREQVEEPSRRRDDDVGPALERRDLLREPDPAVDRRDLHRRVPGELGEVHRDLGGQLARRRQDQRTGHPARLVHQRLDQRQAEGGRFAAPGRRAREDVAAGLGRRDRRGLNGRRLGKAEVPDGPQERGRKVEISERAGACRSYDLTWSLNSFTGGATDRRGDWLHAESFFQERRIQPNRRFSRRPPAAT